MDVIGALGRVDGSVGWTAMVGNGCDLVAPMLPRHVYERIYQDGPDVIIAGSVVPAGKRRPAVLTRELSLRRDLGLDSLRLVALIVQFEERLGIDLGKAGDIDFARIQTIGDVIDVAHILVERTGSHS